MPTFLAMQGMESAGYISRSGDTPLNCAVSSGQTAVVKLLLNRNDVDPNAKGKDSRTPLMTAAGRE
jgi:ankyrin repeat protein